MMNIKECKIKRYKMRLVINGFGRIGRVICREININEFKKEYQNEKINA